ncbi:MAG: hypothetical protein QUS09_02190 [Methanotrichaceae archaeon]|nr:hypothetical protein [Methanotrichaceae archaeon]
MATWLKAELEFASFYSYRMPGLSPQYALASPVPSPASLRLALVDASIQYSGDPEYGRQVFEWVKTAPLWVLPPERVSILKLFVKRLKRPKITGDMLVPSTAVREYCHLGGPLEVYIEVTKPQEIASLLVRTRRLGTSDSIITARVQETEGPPLDLCWRRLSDLDLPTHPVNYENRLVVMLTEFRTGLEFDEVNPFSEARQRRPFEQDSYLLPLVQERKGENWSLYRRQSFRLSL